MFLRPCSRAEADSGCRWAKARVPWGEEERVWELRWRGARWYANPDDIWWRWEGRVRSLNRLIHELKKRSHNLPEQDERTRESTEQWREFHYDGMYPPQEYNRQSIWDWEEERGEAVSWQEALKEMSSTTWWGFSTQTLTVQQQRHQLPNEVFRLDLFLNPCVDDIGFIPSVWRPKDPQMYV